MRDDVVSIPLTENGLQLIGLQIGMCTWCVRARGVWMGLRQYFRVSFVLQGALSIPRADGCSIDHDKHHYSILSMLEMCRVELSRCGSGNTLKNLIKQKETSKKGKCDIPVGNVQGRAQ